MTLIVAAMSRETIWLLADRRISRRGRPVRDDACKVMSLETTDGVALLGYAGLGATAQGTEPSTWMSKVLRGRNMPLESSLEVLAGAAKQQLPRHLKQESDHAIIVAAFLREQPRLYTIGLSPRHKSFHYTRHVKQIGGGEGTVDFALGGSGAMHLVKHKQWKRPLLQLMRAHERGSLSAHVVADQLAKLNFKTHNAMADQSVGPRCIVEWRHRKGGGAHNCYTGTARDNSSISLPTIGRGMDIQAIVNLLWSDMMEAMNKGEPMPRPDDAAMNAKLRTLDYGPDEELK